MQVSRTPDHSILARPTGGVEKCQGRKSREAVQKALWKLSRDGHRWDGSLSRKEWAERTPGMAVEDSWTSGKGFELLRDGHHERGMRPNKASWVVAGQ